MRVNKVVRSITTLVSIQLPLLVRSQYREGTLQHAQSVADGEDVLNEALQSHPDVVDDYFPNKEAAEEYERYLRMRLFTFAVESLQMMITAALTLKSTKQTVLPMIMKQQSSLMSKLLLL